MGDGIEGTLLWADSGWASKDAMGLFYQF